MAGNLTSGSSLTTGRNLLPPQTAFVNPGTGALTDAAYQYLIGLINQLSSAVPTASTASDLTATGTTQATALQLSAQWNEVDTATLAADGVILPAASKGQSITVFNETGIAINVYPPPGLEIDGLGVNAAYSLGNGLRQTFDFLAGTQIRSGD